MAIVDRLHDLVDPLCEELDIELVDLVYEGGVVKISGDQPGGISIDAIRDLTKAVSRALDEHDPISGTYTLEVSSPGLERTLRTPAHFIKAVGTDIKVKTKPGVDGDRRLTGKLTEADDESFTVLSDDGTERRLVYDDIHSARTVFEWGPSPKPGKTKKKSSSPNRKAVS